MDGVFTLPTSDSSMSDVCRRVHPFRHFLVRDQAVHGADEAADHAAEAFVFDEPGSAILRVPFQGLTTGITAHRETLAAPHARVQIVGRNALTRKIEVVGSLELGKRLADELGNAPIRVRPCSRSVLR